MARLSWVNTKIDCWSVYRDVFAQPNFFEPIYQEMRVLEGLAAVRLGFKGHLGLEKQGCAQEEAKRIVNDAVDKKIWAVTCIKAVKELLEFADHKISTQQITINRRLLKSEDEVQLLFKFMQQVPGTLKIVAASKGRMELFNVLLSMALTNKDLLGIIVHKSVNDYNLAHNEFVVEHYNPLLYTPAHNMRQIKDTATMDNPPVALDREMMQALGWLENKRG